MKPTMNVQTTSCPDQDKTVHTEVLMPDGSRIGFDLLCSEEHMQQYRGVGLMYEPDVMAAIINFVRPGDICIDAGANLGYHSILMAKIIGETGQVLCFEPDPVCFEKLKANFVLNKVDHVCFPIPAALWSDDMNLNFYLPHVCGYGSFIKFANAVQVPTVVEAVALDSVLNPEVNVRLLKIDCEGAEEGILHGAEKLLKRGIDAVIAEFNFSITKNDKEIRQYMHDLGYNLFFLFDNGQQPVHIPVDAIIQPSAHRFHFNGLFTKRLLVMQDHWKLTIN